MVNLAPRPEQKVNRQKIDRIEEQIREQKKSISSDTLEYPIEVVVEKYSKGKEEDKNEIFIPDYQREMVWNEDNQSKFIESIFLGLPIPYIFVADVSAELESEDLSRLEIVDGTQRIRTLDRFLNDELTLSNLKKLTELNGLKFSELPLSRRQRFQRTTLRMIALTEETDEDIRRDLFERINSGSVDLNKMEKRIGSQPGLFLDLVQDFCQNERFQSLCYFSKLQKDRRDPQEYVLRFFAFLHNYQEYRGKVHDFLDDFLTQKNEELGQLEQNNPPGLLLAQETLTEEFFSMIAFVSENCPELFSTGKIKKRPNTRSKFESISVGIALALKQNPQLTCADFSFLKTKEFDYLTNKNSSSTNQKVRDRIEYVKNHLL
ncbi:MAG: DUF262 domain-containing protein [Cyanobacteriota bacterium]|jgi:hypothetical protein